LKIFENAWFQQRQGTLHRQQWKGRGQLCIGIYYQRPGGKTRWSMLKMAFASGLRTYLEATTQVSGVRAIGKIIHGKS
jgi:hypothetical protein